MPKAPKREAPAPLVRAEYFPATPTVTDDVQAWAAKNKVRVLAVIPIYVEDVPDA